LVERASSVSAHAPNDVWTVDFKGWWRTLNGDRCERLTVRDAFSRFLLAVVACSTKKRDVRPIFEQLFRKYGVPKAIQCDKHVGNAWLVRREAGRGESAGAALRPAPILFAA
jgi:putative transposase